MSTRHILLAMATVLALAACGGAAAETTVPSVATTATSSATTTSPPSTTTTTTTLAAESGEPYILSTDIVYLDDGQRELALDVYAPTGEGPFPVAVLFHGIPASKADRNMTTTAIAAAEAGMLVFIPDWNPAPSMAPGTADLRTALATTECALGYVEQYASSYGGNPGRVVVSGFSAGAVEAAWLGLGHTTDLPQGCVATAIDYAPVGAVLGDSEYFLHSTYFDPGFAADVTGMQEIAAEIVDPAAWPEDLSATFRIWYAESSSRVRSFDDAWAEDGWLAQRDPDDSIRRDLDNLGLLDDGIISFIDESELLAFRLHGAGLDATAEMHPGGHEMWNKPEAMVTYLLEAAGAA